MMRKFNYEMTMMMRTMLKMTMTIMMMMMMMMRMMMMMLILMMMMMMKMWPSPPPPQWDPTRRGGLARWQSSRDDLPATRLGYAPAPSVEEGSSQSWLSCRGVGSFCSAFPHMHIYVCTLCHLGLGGTSFVVA